MHIDLPIHYRGGTTAQSLLMLPHTPPPQPECSTTPPIAKDPPGFPVERHELMIPVLCQSNFPERVNFDKLQPQFRPSAKVSFLHFFPLMTQSTCLTVENCTEVKQEPKQQMIHYIHFNDIAGG